MLARCAKIDWNAFGRDLENARVAKGETARSLARELGMNRATFARAEQAEPVCVPVFLLICKWMASDPLANLLEVNQ